MKLTKLRFENFQIFSVEKFSNMIFSKNTWTAFIDDIHFKWIIWYFVKLREMNRLSNWEDFGENLIYCIPFVKESTPSTFVLLLYLVNVYSIFYFKNGGYCFKLEMKLFKIDSKKFIIKLMKIFKYDFVK